MLIENWESWHLLMIIAALIVGFFYGKLTAIVVIKQKKWSYYFCVFGLIALMYVAYFFSPQPFAALAALLLSFVAGLIIHVIH